MSERNEIKSKNEKDTAIHLKNEMKKNFQWIMMSTKTNQTRWIDTTTELTIQVNAPFLLQLNHHHCWQHKEIRTNNEFSAEKGRSFPCGYVDSRASDCVDACLCVYAWVFVCVSERAGRRRREIENVWACASVFV